MATTTTHPNTEKNLQEKFIYKFGSGQSDGNANMQNLLGGKGAGLAEMSNIGVPVPSGFTITTDVCRAFYNSDGLYSPLVEEQIKQGISYVENSIGTKFGDPNNPLLVSVRSGARVSMPGMMDTVLNLGLNDTTVVGLAKRSGDERFANDSYRRFIQMYSNVVLGIQRESDLDDDPFEILLENKKSDRGVIHDTDLNIEDIRELITEFKAIVRERTGLDFPSDPWEQLWGAISAVFKSWNSSRAIIFRRINNYPASWGTAVTVQAMVFGNLGEDCATGVLFTRNPKTGVPGLFGEFLVNAQGEDVVAGVRTPQKIRADADESVDHISLESSAPDVYQQLQSAASTLEKHFRDMQDIEFTIQQSKLWILQTRTGKRTGNAMVKIAVDLVEEGIIDENDAIQRQDPEQIVELLHQVFDDTATYDVVATGLAASPGAAVGRIVFTAKEAAEWTARGESVVLVRTETSPDDIEGIIAAKGILTTRGGMTSHAAVVARGWGKCCITGCSALKIDYHGGKVEIQTSTGDVHVVNCGETISINGSTGEVILGSVPLIDPTFPQELDTLMGWVGKAQSLKVRANADTPEDAARARAYGAEGIGLCRTEHMFFDQERILTVRQMILARDEIERRKALSKILPMQRQDFHDIFRAMEGYPVTVRLLDPPLHEFLPQSTAETKKVAASMGISPEQIERRLSDLQESNPMLGHRGVRLAITFPEIYEIQAQAIFEAACELAAENILIEPEIMVPLVSIDTELHVVRKQIESIAETVFLSHNQRVNYSIGTMIELPRACVTADAIAHHADFFSFGTNDLTQTTLGISRDDSGHFFPTYLDKNIFASDPFVELDRNGVGALIEIAVQNGRRTNADLKIGICGEHGGNPASVAFFHKAGINYVSCSPYRVLTARIASAQATASLVQKNT